MFGMEKHDMTCCHLLICNQLDMNMYMNQWYCDNFADTCYSSQYIHRHRHIYVYLSANEIPWHSYRDRNHLCLCSCVDTLLHLNIRSHLCMFFYPATICIQCCTNIDSFLEYSCIFHACYRMAFAPNIRLYQYMFSYRLISDNLACKNIGMTQVGLHKVDYILH